MSIDLITLIMFGGLMLLLIAGIPLAWTLFGIAIAITYFFWDFNSLYMVLANVFGAAWNIVFIAVPLFIWMGLILQESGIADALFEVVHRFAGGLRGGLAMGVVVICAIFGAMCGVASASCITMGVIALPAMLRRGYKKEMALGCIVAPSTLGVIIPPSINMILLAFVAQLSVGDLFMAGLMPGILLTILFCIYIGIRASIQPDLCPISSEKFTFRQKIVSLKALILPICIILAVLGVIFGGIATPTEASSVGVFAMFIAAAINGRFTMKLLHNTLIQTFKIVATVLWIAFGAIAFSQAYISVGGTAFITEIVNGLQVPPYFILLIMMVIIFILGMFLDPGGIIFITVPLFFSTAEALNFDPVWFATVYVLVLTMGYVTPPFGFNLFYMKSIVPPDINMADVYRSVTPFLLIFILGTILVAIFPQIALWFPATMSQIAK